MITTLIIYIYVSYYIIQLKPLLSVKINYNQMLTLFNSVSDFERKKCHGPIHEKI